MHLEMWLCGLRLPQARLRRTAEGALILLKEVPRLVPNYAVSFISQLCLQRHGLSGCPFSSLHDALAGNRETLPSGHWWYWYMVCWHYVTEL